MSGQATTLVIGPAWVGDMVMAQSLFITLQQQGEVIDVLAPAWSLPLLSRMPQVHEGLALQSGHGQLGLGERWRLGRQLRTRNYQRAIVLPRSFKSALVPFFSGAIIRSGYQGEMRYGLLNDRRRLDKQLLPRTVDRYVALAYPADPGHVPDIPQPALQVDEANRQRLLAALALNLDRPVIAFMPGAEYGPAKRWPLAHYAALARSLLAAGKQVWIIGSVKEGKNAEEIAQQAVGVVNLCGKTRLEDAIDLLSLADAAVSNDSGLMHVAAATGTPLVAIYGSSTPAYTPPLADRVQVLYLGMDCSPCFKRVCPLAEPAPCLQQIMPEQVLEALAASGI